MTWITPGRLLVLFCASTLLLFSDRGLVACNSVNGRRADPGEPQTGYGIQVSGPAAGTDTGSGLEAGRPPTRRQGGSPPATSGAKSAHKLPLA